VADILAIASLDGSKALASLIFATVFIENLRLKLRYILWPYLKVLVLFMVGTAVFHTALFSIWPTAEPVDWLWTFVGPLVGCGALLALVLWPNFRLVKDYRRGNLGELFFLVALATMVCSWGGIGHYLRAALSPLRPLATLAELSTSPASRYYQVRQVTLDSTHIGIEQQAEVTGKNNEHLNFRLWIACPVTGQAQAVPAWLGFTYSYQMSSRATQTEKEAAYREFLRTSEQRFNHDRWQPFTYLERSANNEMRQGLRAAASHSPRYQAGTEPPVILLPVHTPFAERGKDAWQVIRWSAIVGNGLFLLLVLVVPLKEVRKLELLAGQPIDRSRGWLAEAVKPFLFRPGYVFTPLLLDTNLLIFAIMASTSGSGLNSFSRPMLLAWGASYGPALVAGEWWRLLSSTLLHGNLMHLANNMVLLGLLGWQLERALGGRRVALVYLLSGLGASLLSYWWHPDQLSIGASGALFGWIGLGVTLFWRPQATASLKLILGSVAFISGGLSLLLGFLTPNIDNVAHLGGLAIGLLLGLVLWPWLRPAMAARALANE
jgi:rhomboid protease GluP